MQIVIPAAGMGSRLGRVTKEFPKCMIRINGETLIERTLRIAEELKIGRVIIITGYKADILQHHVEELQLNLDIHFIHNPQYATTNNIVSVALASAYLKERDTILIESDLIFDKEIITDLLFDRDSKVVLANYENSMDGTVVRLKNRKMIFENSSNLLDPQGFYKTVNIYYLNYKFSRSLFVPLLNIYLDQNYTQSYYESPLKLVGEINSSSLVPHITDRKWFEIDDVNDLDLAEILFSENEMSDIQKRYGGFWRFKKLKDYTYLSNPFFPSKEFLAEIKTELPDLMHHYPSSQDINANLMGAVLNVNPNYVAVGNGASEIIEHLSRRYNKMQIVSETFKEYENRAAVVTKISKLAEIENDESSCVVIVNPNNPDGRLHPAEEIRHNLDRNPETTFVLDESFMDFADSSESLLSDIFVEKYPNLIIVKSIGKSHGVGGLRLGALISSHASVYRHELPIWNINSVAEFYLQRFKKHEKAFKNSLRMIQEERRKLEDSISSLLDIEIERSHGNFVYFELGSGLCSKLEKELFRSGFIVKSIKLSKEKSALRIAVRNGLHNTILLRAISKFIDVN